METIKKIVNSQILVIELGSVSYLKQGSQNGWFEYGRPGHPKDFRPPYKQKN